MESFQTSFSSNAQEPCCFPQEPRFTVTEVGSFAVSTLDFHDVRSEIGKWVLLNVRSCGEVCGRTASADVISPNLVMRSERATLDWRRACSNRHFTPQPLHAMHRNVLSRVGAILLKTFGLSCGVLWNVCEYLLPPPSAHLFVVCDCTPSLRISQGLPRAS